MEVLVQTFSTVVLVFVTIWYAISTKNMLAVMQQDFRLKTLPYLSIERGIGRNIQRDTVLHHSLLQLQFKLINIGNVPFKYKIEAVTLNNKEIHPKPVELYLFPTEWINQWSNVYLLDNLTSDGTGMKGSIRVVFWTDDSKEKYFYVRNFELVNDAVTFVISEQYGKVK
jgi:hypothetical protein